MKALRNVIHTFENAYGDYWRRKYMACASKIECTRHDVHSHSSSKVRYLAIQESFLKRPNPRQRDNRTKIIIDIVFQQYHVEVCHKVRILLQKTQRIIVAKKTSIKILNTKEKLTKYQLFTAIHEFIRK